MSSMQEIMAKTREVLNNGTTNQFSDAQVMQAVQQADAEIVRAMRLGLTGLAAPASHASSFAASSILVQAGCYGSTGISPSIPNTIVGYDLHSGNVWFGQPPHPWLEPEGMASYTRIMRGEEKLPHLPNACEECRKIFRAQLAILKEHDMYVSCGPGKRHKRNPGRVKISRRVQRVRERLLELAARNSERENAA